MALGAKRNLQCPILIFCNVKKSHWFQPLRCHTQPILRFWNASFCYSLAAVKCNSHPALWGSWTLKLLNLLLQVCLSKYPFAIEESWTTSDLQDLFTTVNKTEQKCNLRSLMKLRPLNKLNDSSTMITILKETPFCSLKSKTPIKIIWKFLVTLLLILQTSTSLNTLKRLSIK